MLKIDIDKERRETAHIEINGSLRTILTDTTIAIGGIYTSLKRLDPEAAEKFRQVLTLSVILSDSPIWNQATEDTEMDIQILKEEPTND